MFNRIVVQKALKRSWALDANLGMTTNNPANGQGSVTSRLIYDIFGGEILKTPKKNGWHFYNRIDGKLLDFTRSEMSKSTKKNQFKNLPSAPDETYNYFAQEDYSNFYVKFIRAYEEFVGLEK